MHKTLAAGLFLGLVAVSLAAQNPSPSLTSTSVSPGTITEGSAFTIQMTVKNNGGTSPEGGMTFSFPQLTSSGDGSRVVSVTPPAGFSYGTYPKGSSIRHSNGSLITAQYLMIETWGSWTGGTSKTFTIQIRPATTGTFDVNFRSAMSNSSYVWFNAPSTSSTTDQQGWPVQRKTGTVECAAPGSFTLINPSDGQSFTPNTIATTLSWNAATNAESYDVYFGTSSNPPLKYTSVTTTSKGVGVTSGQSYWWRVVAKRSCTSQTTSSATRSFSVQSLPSLVVTVQDLQGTPRQGAELVRYLAGTGTTVGTNPTLTGPNGQATYTDVTASTAYDLEAYMKGPNPFDNFGELWANGRATVGTNGATQLTLRRAWPYAETFRIFRVSDGQELSGTSTIPPGTQVRLEIVVRNLLSTSKNVTTRVVLDDGAASWERDVILGPQTVGANATTTFTTTYTPSQVGTFRKAVYTRTDGIKTDAWDWGAAFVVQTVPADLVVSNVNRNRPTVTPSGVLQVGFTVANNGGTPTPASGGEVRLSSNNNGSTFEGTLLGSLNVSGLAPGGTQTVSPSALTVPPGTLEGIYYIKVKVDPGNLIPEESNEGNNVAVAAAQVVVARFGTTVITHGYQLGGNLGCWPFQMARAILTRAGGGKILQYNKETNSFQACQSPDPCEISNSCASSNPTGETVLIFDWADDSNNPGGGYSEAAGEALYTALLRGLESSVFPSPLHFIGHSRGTVVNSETAERLLAFGYAIDQVTDLDPVDHGWAGTFLDNDVNTSGVGVVSWSGIGLIDSYFSEDENACDAGISGRRIEGATNLELTGRDIEHTDVHAWYHFTIDTTATTEEPHGDPTWPTCSADPWDDRWFIQNTQAPACATDRSTPADRRFDGFFFSRIGGGRSASCNLPRTQISYKPSSEGIVNGDFRRGTAPEIPGWSFHGGGGDALLALDQTNYRLALAPSRTFRRHNPFYIPSNARTLSYCLKVQKADPFPATPDTVKVYLDDGTTDFQIDSIPLTRQTAGCENKTPPISAHAGKIMRLSFELVRGGNLVDSEAWIDDVALILDDAPATPAPIAPADDASLSTLTPTFQWSAFQPGKLGAARAGYQLRVRSDDEGDWIVYDTGYVASTTSTTHTYAPGVYSGWDLIAESQRTSEALAWGRHYHWHVRYRDANGVWSPWSADSINAHQDFRTFQPGSPAIAVSSPSISATTLSGSSPAAQSFQIWNSGVGTLSYSISDNQSWLTAGPSPSTSTGEHDSITVTFSTASLAPGAYSATITINATGASNTPVQIPVGLIVEGPPTLSLTPASLDFGNVQTGTVAEIAFTVRNSGGGQLVGNASTSGAFSIANGNNYDLGAGQSQSVVVRFAPAAVQTYLGSVSFTGGGGAIRPVSGSGAEITYALSVTRAGTGTGRVTSSPAGILCGEDCTQSYDRGTLVNLTASPTGGSTFAGWSGATDCQDGVVTLTSDLACTATFNAGTSGSGGGGMYHFDDGSGSTATDSSGAGNHGSISGATYVTGRSGAGTALRFGSNTSAVLLPFNLYTGFGNTAYVEAWVRPTAYSSSPCVATVFRKRANYNDWSLEIDSQGRLQANVSAASHTDAAWAAGGSVPLNMWSKVSSWYDGAVLRVYVNDNLVASQAKAFSLDWPGAYYRTEIGNDTYDGGSCWKFFGDIDDVVIAPGPPGGGLDFYTLTPCRLVDTRATSPLDSGFAYSVRVTGICGVPATAKAISVNVTAISPTGSGNLTVWPADLARPVASTINFQSGRTRSNNAVLSLAGDGLGDLAIQPTVAGNGTVHLVLDVTGYFQ